MANLRPCEGCLRHVRSDRERCPFCDHALAIDVSSPAAAPSRLGRAARMAFGAAVATATLAAACGGNKPAETGGSGTAGPTADAAPVAEDANPANFAKPYGAPPADGWLV